MWSVRTRNRVQSKTEALAARPAGILLVDVTGTFLETSPGVRASRYFALAITSIQSRRVLEAQK